MAICVIKNALSAARQSKYKKAISGGVIVSTVAVYVSEVIFGARIFAINVMPFAFILAPQVLYIYTYCATQMPY